jgi:hypothetical protein
MNDNLKRFIDENRAEFDSESPSGLVYERIAGKKPARSRLVHMLASRWSIAAASVVAVMMVLFFTMKPGSGPASENTANDSEQAIYDEDPVYSVQIAQFRQIIDLQQEQLKQLEKDNPALYNQFTTDISQLDSSYRALREQLGNNPNRETLLEAMINNLQLQSELLTKQLIIIREIKQNKNSHEKTRI